MAFTFPRMQRPHRELNAMRNGAIQIHLIIGPTGIGKTARAVELARKTGAPVVVLDRVQVYPELATGSGRPPEDELQGTERHYLAQRRIADGELMPHEALHLLQGVTDALTHKHRCVILEGGSISLNQAIWQSGFLQRHQVVVTCLMVDDWNTYRQKLYERVHAMLCARPAITQELATIWARGNPAELALVKTMIGYDALLAWCDKNLVPPQNLPRACGDKANRDALAREITRAHLTYAAHQQAAFARLQRAYDVSFAMEVAC